MKKTFVLLWVFCLLSGISAQDSLLRYGFFVGANNGGPGREQLRYADSDAQALASVMQELGGLSPKDTVSLTSPTSEKILQALSSFSKRIGEVHTQAKRVEFIFYYSGHSDEEGLLLGNEKLTYPRLRSALNTLNADVRIAILDSCSSGSFTRLKGGVKAAPFLVDASSVLKGHAYLTSSSENEASQESDRIGGSFFTYYLISGLRGAADTTGDGRVTLNEIYQHAFKETVARTENTIAGPQHPSYDIQLSGTGDLVLTDINSQSSRLVLGKEISGRVYVRTASGQLQAEVQKNLGEQIPLALGAGEYVISVQTPTQYLTGKKSLDTGDVKILTLNDLKALSRETNRTRGPLETKELSEVDPEQEETSITISFPKLPKIPFLPFFNPEDPAEEQMPTRLQEYNFNLGLVPGLELHPGFNKKVGISAHGLISQTAETNGLQFAGLLSFSGKLKGLQFSGIGNINTGKLEGVQGAGIFNIAGNSAQGVQNAGIFNIVPSSMEGVQTAGIFSISGKTLKGVQASGIFNIAGEGVQGIQTAGIFNIVGGTLKGLQGAGIFNRAGESQGLQAAGIINMSDNLQGLQVGPINKASQVEGLQIGLINISDHVDGLALGLLTISDNAIHRLTYSRDSLGYTWSSYQWGANNFFTSLSLGAKNEDFSKNAQSLIRGFTFGHIWGDQLRFTLEAGVYLLPTASALVNPWDLGESGGSYSGVKGSVGYDLGLFHLYGGLGLNCNIPGWNTPSELTGGHSFSFAAGDSPVDYRSYLFFGGSLGL